MTSSRPSSQPCATYPGASDRGPTKLDTLANTSRRANMCSCRRGHDPPCRPRRLLRVGRAARRPPAARSAGDRRRRRRARGELRGEGVRGPDRDGRPRRRAGSARTRSSSRPACRPTPRRARRCSRCSRTRRRSSRGSRSTRPSWTFAGSSGSRARRRRSRARLRRERARPGRAPDHGRRRADQVPRQGGERAWRSRTGCWSSRPTASSASSIRCRSSGCGVSGGSRPRSSTRGIRTVGQVAALDEADARRRCSAAPRAGTSTRSRTTAIRGPVQTGRRRRSIGSQRALGRAADVARRRSTVTHRLVDRVTRRLRAGRRVVSHGRSAAAVRRLHASDPLAHAAARRPAARRRSSPPPASCSPPSLPLIERRGITLVGHLAGEPRGRGRGPARADRWTGGPMPWTSRSTGARALRLLRHHARRPRGPRPGACDAAPARLTRAIGPVSFSPRRAPTFPGAVSP